MLTRLDVSRSYQSLASSWDAQSMVDLADGGRAAGPNLEALVELGSVPGTTGSFDELTQEIESFNSDANTLSEPTRYAVSIYIGLVAFAPCAAYCLQHPDPAQLTLNASTPATWSWMVAAAVYRGLGGPPKE